MKPLHYLLIIFLGPSFIVLALGIVYLVVSSAVGDYPDPRPTGTIGVKKGGRLGSPSELLRRP